MWPIYGIALVEADGTLVHYVKPQGLGGNYALKCEVRMAHR